MLIGSYQLENNLILAPMAGISGRPFRELCKQFGAGSALLRDETLVKKILEYVLDNTGADTIMIGRLLKEIHGYLIKFIISLTAANTLRNQRFQPYAARL
jgi:tRNA-dihydrouridine synthase